MSVLKRIRVVSSIVVFHIVLSFGSAVSAEQSDNYLERWQAMNNSMLQPNWVRFFTHAATWTGKPHMDIMGIYQPTYTDFEDDRVDTFGFTRARLGVRGAVTNNITFWTLFETARNGVTGPTDGGFRLLDAQINWNIGDFVNLRMGQFIPDFSQTIAAGAFVDWIDYTDIEKTVWFFNRQGDGQTTALRELGASLWNEYHSGNHVWAHAGYWIGEREFSGEEVDKTKYSATIGYGNFIKDKYWIMAEYLDTDEEQPLNADDVESDGFYIAAGWKPHPRWKLVYRYSECDCEENIGPPGPSDTEQHTFSLTHFLKGQMKIVAQYDINNDDLGVVDFKDDNAFRVYFSMPLSYRITK